VAGQETAENTALLDAMGVTHVVNCAALDVTGPVPKPHRQVLQLKASDSPTYDILSHLAEVQAFLHEVSPRRALIHCHAGVNRSVSLALALAHTRTPFQLVTLAAIVANHRTALTNPGFRKQLLQWAKARQTLK
jgi:protein-tyrosine phosphatase